MVGQAVRAYVGLGSNMGEREVYLLQAVQQMQDHPLILFQACSTIYETPPVGIIEQSAFLNMVVRMETSLSAEVLLSYLLAIELKLGRVRTVKWGPRIIDLDVLWMAGQRRDGAQLQLPHPRMAERAFVLLPLHDVWHEDDQDETVWGAWPDAPGIDEITVWGKLDLQQMKMSRTGDEGSG